MDAFEAVSMPEPSPVIGQRFFTVPEANRALVLVRRIIADIVRDYRRLRGLQEAHQTYDEKGNVVLAEQARQDYVCIFNHISELRDELEDIGCELKDYDLGLVDFPALHDGREIVLCWKLGEEAVEHWHEIAAGFAGRQRISKDF